MGELTTQDRLQPSLLDRLTDDDPSSQQESRQERVLSLRQYRQAVLRDLGWLFNTSANRLPEDDLADFPFVASSVLNFGIPDLTGSITAMVIGSEMEQRILNAVRYFEPRVLGNSVSVKINPISDQAGQHALSFEIIGELWAKPLPEALYLKTELDLETGQCVIEDQGSG